MSLCPLSWKNIERLNRQHGRQFVQITAHHSGILVAVDVGGQVWEIDRRSNPVTITLDDNTTTTATRLRDGNLGDDEWGSELQRRVQTLS